MSSRQQNSNYGGKVISVNWGRVTRRIGIDGPPDAIKETIKTVFEMRTNRPFWLEDGGSVARTINRDMPQGNYTLHVDEGLMINVCSPDEPENVYSSPGYAPRSGQEKIFYTDDDFHGFLSRRGWICLREYMGTRNVDVIDELHRGGVYRGVSQAQSIGNASFIGRISDDGGSFRGRNSV